jgi:hypothetical protein
VGGADDAQVKEDGTGAVSIVAVVRYHQVICSQQTGIGHVFKAKSNGGTAETCRNARYE